MEEPFYPTTAPSGPPATARSGSSTPPAPVRPAEEEEEEDDGELLEPRALPLVALPPPPPPPPPPRAQRLVARDLSNASEPVLPSLSSSHASNSSQGNSSLRPNIRASKAIGHYPRPAAAAGSKEGTGEAMSATTVGPAADTQPPPAASDGPSQVAAPPNASLPEAQGPARDAQSLNESEAAAAGKEPASHSAKPAAGAGKGGGGSEAPAPAAPAVEPPRTEAPAQRKTANSTEASRAAAAAPAEVAGPGVTVVVSRQSAPPPASIVPGSLTTSAEDDRRPTSLHVRESAGRSAFLSSGPGPGSTPAAPSGAPPVSKSRVAASPAEAARAGLDAASITGIALGIVVFAGLTGAVSFILYRRRYLNKPQTLNDKCSNPDSSGYIDDSTLRENSEEMYSLDNDSFLNSLEAMTIQNYWTDNVKHTKL